MTPVDRRSSVTAAQENAEKNGVSGQSIVSRPSVVTLSIDAALVEAIDKAARRRRRNREAEIIATLAAKYL